MCNISGNVERLGAKVIRLNMSELYQHLNVKSILQQMVDRQLILPAKKGDVEAYSHNYAQNLVATRAILERKGPLAFLSSLCHVLEATDLSCQKKLALKLRSGVGTL